MRKNIKWLLIEVVLVGLLAGQAFAGSVTGPIFNPAAVAIRGGAINGTTVGATTPAAGTFSTLTSSNAQITGGAIAGITGTSTFVGITASGTVIANIFYAPGYIQTPAYLLGGNLLFSEIDPVIASGFGTSPSIVPGSGTATFRVNVGTGGAATGGVLTMTAATTGWNCSVNETGGASTITRMSSSTATSVTLLASAPWAASTILSLICIGY